MFYLFLTKHHQVSQVESVGESVPVFHDWKGWWHGILLAKQQPCADIFVILVSSLKLFYMSCQVRVHNADSGIVETKPYSHGTFITLEIPQEKKKTTLNLENIGNRNPVNDTTQPITWNIESSFPLLLVPVSFNPFMLEIALQTKKAQYSNMLTCLSFTALVGKSFIWPISFQL